MVWLYFFTSCLWFIDKSLHDFWVFAWMDGKHSTIYEGAVFFGYSFILILRINILEYLFGSKWFPIEVVPFNPKSWRKIILIVGDINVIFSKLLLYLFYILISCDLHKTPFIFVLTLNYLLLSQFLDSLGWGSSTI